MSWFDDILTNLGNMGTSAINYASSPKGLLRLGSMGATYLMQDNDLLSAQSPQVGYQGSIPSLSAVREQVPIYGPKGIGQGQTGIQQLIGDPNRRPGSGGRRYFSDMYYAGPGEETVTNDLGETTTKTHEQSAREMAQQQAAQFGEMNARNYFREDKPKPAPKREAGVSTMTDPKIVKAADGGLMGLKAGRYLNGSTDGMADEVPARIDGKEEARLSDGEYVVPADVISHLGNGNSEAGAKVMDAFLAKIRKERTGNEKQGKQIDPNKMLPA